MSKFFFTKCFPTFKNAFKNAYLVIFFYLKEKVTVEVRRLSIYWFILQLLATVRAGQAEAKNLKLHQGLRGVLFLSV